MHGPRSTVGLALAALLLAGCTGGETASGPPAATHDDDTGGVSGSVTDTEFVPLEGAQVVLQPGTDYSAVTGPDGSYAISNVPPGEYTLLAQRLGYDSLGLKVKVEAGAVTEKNLVLEPIPVANPRRAVFGPFDGYMQCRMATILSSGACGFVPVVGNTPATSIWTNDKVLWDFGKLNAKDWTEIVFESRWKPSVYASNPNMMQVFSYSNRTSQHWFSDSGSRGSPIKFTYSQEDGGPGGQHPGDSQPKKPNEKITLRTWLTLPFGTATKPMELAYELRFQMAVTVFYSDTAPEDYSALPDA